MDHKNYRPISILPSFSKIIEKLMLNRMLSVIERNNFLNDRRHGFRNKHSTITALARLFNHITSAHITSALSNKKLF